MLPIHTILYPTDFSLHSEAAFGLACALARDYGARLVILHVGVSPVVAFADGVVGVEPPCFREELRERLHEIRPADPRIPVEHRVQIASDPVLEILETAKEIDCDLIVLGTHGRTGLRRVLLGSVAEQLVRRAPCPVLTVKSPVHLEEQAAVPAGSAPVPSAPVETMGI